MQDVATGAGDRRRLRIGLVCSHGGHMTELLQVASAFDGHDTFFITYDSAPTRAMDSAYLVEHIGLHPVRMVRATARIVRILLRERPDLIVSTGAEIAIPTFYLAWALRKLTIMKTRLLFIESWTRVTMPTRTGKLVYPIADVFLVQWEQMLDQYGRRARYGGIIL
jgi:UDP-N-acetylglucosamine:LPS N-acetylglucosamine transferase